MISQPSTNNAFDAVVRISTRRRRVTLLPPGDVCRYYAGPVVARLDDLICRSDV